MISSFEYIRNAPGMVHNRGLSKRLCDVICEMYLFEDNPILNTQNIVFVYNVPFYVRLF